VGIGAKVSSDTTTDDYGRLQARYGPKSPKANGYRSAALFKREQAIVLERIAPDRIPILDIGCGTGLMLQPLVARGVPVIGLDFNAGACRAARANSVKAVQCDAFDMPFPRASIAQAISCGFLNQFKPEKVAAFMAEVARILMPGGRAIILWRHGDSFMHRVAHPILASVDRLTGAQPAFPQNAHPMDVIRRHLAILRLKVIEEAITLPFPGPRTLPAKHRAGWLFGASQLLVFEKPRD